MISSHVIILTDCHNLLCTFLNYFSTTLSISSFFTLQSHTIYQFPEPCFSWRGRSYCTPSCSHKSRTSVLCIANTWQTPKYPMLTGYATEKLAIGWHGWGCYSLRSEYRIHLFNLTTYSILYTDSDNFVIHRLIGNVSMTKSLRLVSTNHVATQTYNIYCVHRRN